ncbi:16S rRNA (guanine(527)-N(7))-methyltransferase RsmG [Roseovarius aestuariivivens]|uniref:16S rRNA (guanine(527)-N(7))-methyltransferase RsmG n=1 Tax=Roseovarius aestuariivivens TaxID=1888910 RepID=UPI0010812489|nr:16S rRNA (guanine(527)-N(7))-methyltransferase RsmG [Roseovarius aestuariivivens]
MTDVPDLDVSRETMDRLQLYAELLRKWNPRINLVSKSTLKDLWTRHIADSAQIAQIAPDTGAYWADLGSGGGFPGLVVSILGMETGHPTHVSLVESDVRKSAFLRTVIRETGAPARVINDRIEDIAPLGADVVSARALADLSTLLEFAHRHLLPGGTALFLKGAQWKKELPEAQSKWNFQHRIAKSKTEDGPVILSVTGVSRV